MTTWKEWEVGEHEIHIIPWEERMRHITVECWCGPITEPRADCKTVIRHRVRGDDFLARAGLAP